MHIIASFIGCTVKTKNEKSNFDATHKIKPAAILCDWKRVMCDTDKLFILIIIYIEYERFELQHLRVL